MLPASPIRARSELAYAQCRKAYATPWGNAAKRSAQLPQLRSRCRSAQRRTRRALSVFQRLGPPVRSMSNQTLPACLCCRGQVPSWRGIRPVTRAHRRIARRLESPSPRMIEPPKDVVVPLRGKRKSGEHWIGNGASPVGLEKDGDPRRTPGRLSSPQRLRRGLARPCAFRLGLRRGDEVWNEPCRSSKRTVRQFQPPSSTGPPKANRRRPQRGDRRNRSTSPRHVHRSDASLRLGDHRRGRKATTEIAHGPQQLDPARHLRIARDDPAQPQQQQGVSGRGPLGAVQPSGPQTLGTLAIQQLAGPARTRYSSPVHLVHVRGRLRRSTSRLPADRRITRQRPIDRLIRARPS